MLFAEMMEAEAKDAFLQRKDASVNADAEELARLRDYVYSARCDEDLCRLRQGDYFLRPPRMFYLRKAGSGRRRKVYSFPEPDKFLLQYMAGHLLRKTDSRFPPTLYSCRVRNDAGGLYSRIRRYDPRREKYVVKADIRSYGESVDVSVLDSQLAAWLPEEPEARDFIRWLVSRNCYYTPEGLEQGFTSVMPGNPLTAYLENVYLLKVDAFLAEHAEISCRYADDICAFCGDRESAEKVLAGIREIAGGELNLTLNEEKTGILPPGEPLDLLGLKYGPGYVDVADNTFRKAYAKITHRAGRIDRQAEKGFYPREEAARKMAAYLDGYFYGGASGSVPGWAARFFPCITRTERLQLLDRLSQESIRFAGTGRRTNGKYRIRYKDIKQLGYVPLVHSYYHRGGPDAPAAGGPGIQTFFEEEDPQ